MTYPATPGSKGAAETSAEAAEAMQPKCGRLQQMTLAAIAARASTGCTADEAADLVGMDRWSIQPRCSELRAKGLIRDSGQRRRNVTGKRAVVWVLPEYAPADQDIAA